MQQGKLHGCALREGFSPPPNKAGSLAADECYT